MTDMNLPRVCPFCGEALPHDAPKGFCPKCLLDLFGGRPLATPEAGSSGVSAKSGVRLASRAMYRLGEYELIGQIAEGGMGIVYLARHTRFNRTVALKLIRSGQLATGAELQRFHTEAEAAAALDHPNIVPIYEIGEHDGQPFFTMKLIEGGSLAERIPKSEIRITTPKSDVVKMSAPSDCGLRPSFDMPQAALVIAKVARAVHHAHQRGVLHRDLKPTNILLDDAGEPHLTDFGLAKLMDQVGLTQTQIVVGTPSYMAPEQASGQSRQLTTAADIYSLGAILYELLAGRPPFDGDSAIEILSQVKEREPEPPRKLNPQVEPDLETICLKCLQKIPDRRYSTAQSLAEELERFLRGEPIQARPVAAGEKLVRWCRRKPALATALGALAFALVFGFAGVTWQWRRADSHANSETRQRLRAEEAVFRLTFEKAETLFEQDRAAQALAHLARLLRQYPTNPVVATRIQSALSLRTFCLPVAPIRHERTIRNVQFSPDGQRVLSASVDGTARISDALSGKMLFEMKHPREVWFAMFSRDGQRILTASADGVARIWDAGDGHLVTEAMKHEDAIEAADFSPAGDRVVTGSRDKTARVWDAATGRPVTSSLVHRGAVEFVKFSPDGRQVVTVSEGSRVRRWNTHVWNAETGGPEGPAIIDQPGLPNARFTPDGSQVLVANISFFDPTTGKALRRLPETGEWTMLSAEFSPDKETLLTGSSDYSARVWDWKTAQPLTPPMRHNHYVIHASYSADGRSIVTGSRDNTARLWDTQGRPLSEPMRTAQPVWQTFINADGTRVVTKSEGTKAWIQGNVAWLWEVRHRPPVPTYSHTAGLLWAAFSRDGRRLITTSQDRTARLWDVASGRLLAEPFLHGAWINHAVFSPDEKQFATGAQDWSARLWDPSSHAPTRVFQHRDHVRWVEFSPDGAWLATASFDKTAQVWDVRTGQRVGKTIQHDGRVHAAHFSPDGKRLVTSSQEGVARVWDAATGEPITPPMQTGPMLLNARFTPDGRKVVTASQDHTARIWDAATGKQILPSLEHSDELALYTPDISADGRRVLTAAGNSARIWDIETGQPLTAALTHSSGIRSAWFSPDGTRVVTTSADKTARLWDAATGLPISEPLPHDDIVANACFSPDGRWLLTLSDDSHARLWEVPAAPTTIPAWLPDFAEAVGGLRFNAQNMLETVPTETFPKLRKRLETLEGMDRWTIWTKWFFADSRGRAFWPSFPATPAEFGTPAP